MKYESGAGGVQYDYFSVNGQMARELKRTIKEKKRLELALELLAAVNRDAHDRAKYNVPASEVERPRPNFREISVEPGVVRYGGRIFRRHKVYCYNHNREEHRLRRIS